MVRRQERIGYAAIEDRGRAAEPHVGLRIHALESEPIEDLLRSHVEPAHVDVGMSPLEGVLQQGELVAAVWRVDDDRRARVGVAGQDAKEREAGQRAPWPPHAPRGRATCRHPGRVLRPRRHFASASRLANRRNAPGTPEGSWRKKLSPV